MRLTAANVLHHLLDRGLVTREAVADRGSAVVGASSRNRNFKVFCGGHPAYFVKQPRAFDAGSVATLAREAACYRLAGTEPDLAALAPLLPRFDDFDPERHVLVLELLPESESVASYHRRTGAFPTALASRLGRLLGTLHGHAGRRLRHDPPPGVFPRRLPWIFSAPRLGRMLEGSAGNSQVLAIVERFPEFRRALDAVAARWRYEALIHGDIKWENCVLHATGDPGLDEPGLKIVDWELADVGDPCWDAGAVFQCHLSFWIKSMPADPGLSPDERVAAARHPLAAMRPAIRSFWRSYLDAQGVADAAGRRLLEQSVRAAGARMIQTAFEAMYAAPRITPAALTMLQVSLNVLTRPQEAIETLLGLPTGPVVRRITARCRVQESAASSTQTTWARNGPLRSAS